MTSGLCFENKWFYMKFHNKFWKTFDPWMYKEGIADQIYYRCLRRDEHF